MSGIAIAEESTDSLESYASVPIAFTVSSRFRIEPVASGLEGFSFHEEPVVAPAARGQGVGTRLMRHVEQWAQERGCRTLKIETQNINVPACRFYARGGCTLGAVLLHAYPELPDEVQLLWYKDLPVAETIGL